MSCVNSIHEWSLESVLTVVQVPFASSQFWIEHYVPSLHVLSIFSPLSPAGRLCDS